MLMASYMAAPAARRAILANPRRRESVAGDRNFPVNVVDPAIENRCAVFDLTL
jgi:hypothetical protein